MKMNFQSEGLERSRVCIYRKKTFSKPGELVTLQDLRQVTANHGLPPSPTTFE